MPRKTRSFRKKNKRMRRSKKNLNIFRKLLSGGGITIKNIIGERLNGLLAANTNPNESRYINSHIALNAILPVERESGYFPVFDDYRRLLETVLNQRNTSGEVDETGNPNSGIGSSTNPNSIHNLEGLLRSALTTLQSGFPDLYNRYQQSNQQIFIINSSDGTLMKQDHPPNP